MAARHLTSVESSGASETGSGSLPPWKAFVIQLTRETNTKGSIFAGRIEHLGSGRRERFESREDLLASMARLLQAIEDENP